MTQLMLIVSAVLLLQAYLRVKPSMRKAGPFLPDSLLFGIGLYTGGAVLVWVSNPGAESGAVSLMSLTALNSALVGGLAFAFLCGNFYRRVNFTDQFGAIDSGPIEQAAIRLLLAVSVLVSLVFVYVVFSNSIVAALLSIASLTTESTLLDARKAITAGSEGYFAPGYVKQFRDILIPLLLIALMAMSYRHRRSILAWIAAAAALVAMTVSGQRLVFVVFFASLMLGSYYVTRFRSQRDGSSKGHGRRLGLAIVTLLSVYGGITFLLGRANTDLAPAALLVDVFLNLGDRVLLAAPRENIITYSVWASIGPTGGASWLADLGAILPGVEESLANLLHAAAGGSYQGNSPLGLPADVWLAWGWAGLVVVPFIYVFTIGLFDMILLSNRSALFFATKIYLFVVLPIFYSPYLFSLYGGAASTILIGLILAVRSRFWSRLS